MKKVEFVSYDGAFPNRCSGTLVIKVNGVEYVLQNCLDSGGHISITEDDEIVEHGEWRVCVPEELSRYQKQIAKCVNENVPWGCCGGCL